MKVAVIASIGEVAATLERVRRADRSRPRIIVEEVWLG